MIRPTVLGIVLLSLTSLATARPCDTVTRDVTLRSSGGTTTFTVAAYRSPEASMPLVLCRNLSNGVTWPTTDPYCGPSSEYSMRILGYMSSSQDRCFETGLNWWRRRHASGGHEWFASDWDEPYGQGWRFYGTVGYLPSR